MNLNPFARLLKRKPTVDLQKPAEEQAAPQSMSKRFVQRMLKLFSGPKEGKGRHSGQLKKLRADRRRNRRFQKNLKRIKFCRKSGGGGARPIPEIKPKKIRQFIKIEKKVRPDVVNVDV